MTDYTDLIARLREAHANSPQRIAGSMIFDQAAAAIAALTAERDALIHDMERAQSALSEMAMDVLASSGQAQEAYQSQLAAEAERDALRDALGEILVAYGPIGAGNGIANEATAAKIARAALTSPPRTAG